MGYKIVIEVRNSEYNETDTIGIAEYLKTTVERKCSRSQVSARVELNGTIVHDVWIEKTAQANT